MSTQKLNWYFWTCRGLPQSEENECMWRHSAICQLRRTIVSVKTSIRFPWALLFQLGPLFRDLFIFSVRVSPFLFQFLCYPYITTFVFHVVSHPKRRYFLEPMKKELSGVKSEDLCGTDARCHVLYYLRNLQESLTKKMNWTKSTHKHMEA